MRVKQSTIAAKTYMRAELGQNRKENRNQAGGVCFTDASEGNLFISKILNIDYLKKIISNDRIELSNRIVESNDKI